MTKNVELNPSSWNKMQKALSNVTGGGSTTPGYGCSKHEKKGLLMWQENVL